VTAGASAPYNGGMKRALAAVLLGAVALAGCASSGRKPHAPTHAGAPPTPVAQVQAEVRAARVSNARLFAIFPRLPGVRPCVIPVIEGLRESQLAGTCRTRVWYPTTHGHGEARVAFRESWGRGWFSTWTMWEELPTRKVLVTKLHGKPAPQLRYAATDSVAGDIELTRHVPCPGTQHQVGPAQLRTLKAVTAVMCGDGFRIYPGQGQWEVFVRKVAVSGVAASQRYFEQPDRPNWPPQNAVCTADLVGITPIAFVDAQGHWLVPRTPIDGCNHPLGLPKGEQPTWIRWHVVSVHRIKQQISAPALAASCPMKWGNSVAWAGPPRDSTGGPLFPVAPKTVRICVFRTPPSRFAVGHFVRGFRLDASRTRRLLRALTGSGPRRGCAKQRTFAVVIRSPGSVASVELGGCWRVDRGDHLAGTAKPAMVRAILRAR
jgi:outer membrane murein-binding lipoprotein Lpp